MHFFYEKLNFNIELFEEEKQKNSFEIFLSDEVSKRNGILFLIIFNSIPSRFRICAP